MTAEAPMTAKDFVDFAKRFVGAIQAGDTEAVRACYAPDAKIWHNNDGVEQTVDQNMKVLDWFIRALPDRNYRVLRVEALPDGFLQQHDVAQRRDLADEEWSAAHTLDRR